MASGHDQHHHGHVHMDEAHWESWADQTELEGEVLLAYVTDTAARIADHREADAPPVDRVLDIGSGPGVGTCELARRFPDAEVVAVDGSPAMLDRARRRAAEHGLQDRISTHLAELPDGLDGLAQADVIWASLSLHHVGDEVGALRLLGGLLAPSGILAIAEMAEPMRLLPDDLGFGRPGLRERLEESGGKWFASMRDGLPDSVPSADLASMVASAGLEVIDMQLARQRIEPPLAADGRRLALGHLRRIREHLDGRLDGDDLHTLDVLTDADDPRSVLHRPDVFVESSRQIVLARRP